MVISCSLVWGTLPGAISERPGDTDAAESLLRDRCLLLLVMTLSFYFLLTVKNGALDFRSTLPPHLAGVLSLVGEPQFFPYITQWKFIHVRRVYYP
jgi:hypothetical protein